MLLRDHRHPTNRGGSHKIPENSPNSSADKMHPGRPIDMKFWRGARIDTRLTPSMWNLGSLLLAISMAFRNSHGLSVICSRFQSLPATSSQFQSPPITFNHFQSLWLSQKHKTSLTTWRMGKPNPESKTSIMSRDTQVSGEFRAKVPTKTVLQPTLSKVAVWVSDSLCIPATACDQPGRMKKQWVLRTLVATRRSENGAEHRRNS